MYVIHEVEFFLLMKVLAIYDHGYTYAFLFTSNPESFAELNSDLYSGPHRLSSTSRAIYQLATCYDLCLSG